MKIRYGILVLAGSITAALGVSACGGGGGSGRDKASSCEAYCTKAVTCPDWFDDEGLGEVEGADHGSCLENCSESDYTAGTIDCMRGVICEGEEIELFECLASNQPLTPDCVAGCEKWAACDGDWLDDDIEDCSLSCSIFFSEPMQACLASMDASCSTLDDCWDDF